MLWLAAEDLVTTLHDTVFEHTALQDNLWVVASL
jgi:hypothetical protein